MDTNDTIQSCSQCLSKLPLNNLVNLSCLHSICHLCVFRNFYLTQTEVISSYITNRIFKVNCAQCDNGYCTITPSQLINWIKVKENNEDNKCKKHQTAAEQYCQQCERIFCPECISIHNDLGNSHHKLTSNVMQRQLRCSLHDSKLKMFCVLCKKAICSCCVSLNHNQHPVKHLKEFSKEALENIELLRDYDIKSMLECLADSAKEFNEIYEKRYSEAIKEIDAILKYFFDLKENYTKKMKEMQMIQCNINDLLTASYEKVINDLNDIDMSNDINQIMFYNDIWINIQLPIEDTSFGNKNIKSNNYNAYNRNTLKVNQMTQLNTESKMDTLPDSVDFNNNDYQFNHKGKYSNKTLMNTENDISNNKDISISCFKTLTTNKYQIKSLLELPDGKLASGGYKEIKVWDKKKDYQCIQTLQGHNGYINSLNINTEGHMTSLGDDNSLLIWDIDSYHLIKELKEQKKPTKSIILLSDGKIASISGDSVISIRNPKENYTCVQSLTGHKDKITAIILLERGLIASSSVDSTIRIWKPKPDKESYEQKWILKEHTAAVNNIVEINNGSHILSCSDDCTIRLWRVEGGFNCIGTYEAHKSKVTSIILLSDGVIASSSTDASIKLWKAHYKLSM